MRLGVSTGWPTEK
uniref:Uncharacterized protein n=1 Tax=Timema shepardi TaxID=629360 RepID=A0A7R9G591_TIMSH|nr:unnamed protein product [Timema shepardi]